VTIGLGRDTTPDPAGLRGARYLVRAPAPVTEVARLVDELRVHPVLAATVWARGLRDDVARSLAPTLERAPIPALEEAAARLARALERGERVLVHGDYDADGVSATAVLTIALRALGGSVTPYLPDRLEDGYGLHPDRVAGHAEAADVVVTLDCGIGDVAQVAALRAAGVDVIVVDHHQPGDTRPDALVVHSHDGIGTADLTGAGLAYHLVWALHEHLGLAPPSDLSDVAALGTIADVAPLLGPNRALVKVGLERLADSQRPGLRALVALAKLRPPLSARNVAFVLGPRLNAAGRLGQADAALELLLTASERRGRVLATLLEGLNAERKRIQDAMSAEAVALAEVDDAPALVLRGPDWHRGVMGIVASHLVERFHRPAFIVAGQSGSVRTPPGCSAVGALDAAREHLVRWGGHAAAAGFTLDEARFDAFRATICEHVATISVPARRVTADVVLHPGQVDADLHAALQALEPYGAGLTEPLFAIPGRIGPTRAMGNGGAHLQTHLDGVRAVGWGMGAEVPRHAYVDRAVGFATVTSSRWQERTTIELRLEGIAVNGSLALDRDADHSRTPTPSALAAPDRAAAERVVVRSIEPVDDDPLAPLGMLLRAGTPFDLDLGPDGPSRLRALAAAYPSVADARRAFVLRKRGRPWPWDGALAQRLERVLVELDLLDDRGRARAGRQVNPYDASSLRRWVVARHALDTLAALLETLPPSDVQHAIAALAGGATGTTARR
jgi:single-stranded-DNA-specific exonuclease